MSLSSPEIASREIELRCFEIDSDKIRTILVELGATSLGAMDFKRAVLDVDPPTPDKWIRVRTDGTVTTLAVKQRISHEADGTGEIEVEVSDFDTTLELLKVLHGYTPRSIQENCREIYMLDGAEVCIDSWPLIGDILEIEASDVEKIHAVAAKLDISENSLVGLPVEQYYLQTLGIDVKNVKKLCFEHNL